MKIGDHVSWQGVSRVFSGVITGERPDGYIVTMESGKAVILSEESILHTSLPPFA